MKPWLGPLGDETDSFRGGITWQLDGHLAALEDATIRDDARLFANLVAQVAAILAPKLSAEEYHRLSRPEVSKQELEGFSKREARREYERALFQSARDNLAEMLRLVSKRGLYAMEDKSPEKPVDISQFALRD